MENLEKICEKVKETTSTISIMNNLKKKEVLIQVAQDIIIAKDTIIKANDRDIENAVNKKMKESLIDRLKLNEKRIKEIANSLKKIANLEDPVGEILEGKVLDNGLEIIKKRVPLGVIAIIYEARPNVTIDAFGLCFKTGNAVILRGGSDAINTNIEIVKIIKETLTKLKISSECIHLIEDTSRESALKLMKLNQYIDGLIPRVGDHLLKTV